ncbi:MAG: anti-sigma factor family protein [Fidelibacterota bacterium]
MECDDLIQYLSDYMDHNLDEELTAEAREHLATCQNCRVVLDTTQRTISLFRKQGERRIPAGRRQGLYERLQQVFLERDKKV